MTSLHVSDTLDLPEDLVTESNAVLGKKGSGKTSAGVVLFEEMYNAGMPVVAVDPKGDWYGVRSSADGKGQGLPIPVFGGLHGDIPLEATGGKALADLIRAEHMSCILDVSEFSAAERRRFLTPFADQLYRANDRTIVHLILEEAHEYIPQRVDGGDAQMVGVFERLVKNGRFKGIGVTMLSQRSASLNKNVLTQCDNLFIMRTTSPQDRSAVADWIKFEDGSSEILASMSSLASGECWLYQPSRGAPVRFQFRMRTTFDAGATPTMGDVRTEPTNLANVDLTAIAAAMAETIEKAKADDPRELRRQITDLKKQLAEQVTPEPERIEVHVITPEDLEALDKASNVIAEAIDGWHKAQDRLYGRVRDVVALQSAPTAKIRTLHPVPAQPVAATHSVPIARHASPPASLAVVGDRGPLVKAERAVLTILAQRGQQTVQQVGMLSGYVTTGGGFRNALGSLRTAGYITPSRDPLEITQEGLTALGTFEPLPEGPALVEFWLSRYGRAERLVLDTVIQAWPNPITAEQVALATGYEPTGGGFRNAVGKLRTLGLISGKNDALTANEELGEAAHS